MHIAKRNECCLQNVYGYTGIIFYQSTMHYYVLLLRKERRKKGNVLFNDALNTFYLRLYDVGHIVKDRSDRERGNPLPPHMLLFPLSSTGSFICTIP